MKLYIIIFSVLVAIIILILLVRNREKYQACHEWTAAENTAITNGSPPKIICENTNQNYYDKRDQRPICDTMCYSRCHQWTSDEINRININGDRPSEVCTDSKNIYNSDAIGCNTYCLLPQVIELPNTNDVTPYLDLLRGYLRYSVDLRKTGISNPDTTSFSSTIFNAIGDNSWNNFAVIQKIQKTNKKISSYNNVKDYSYSLTTNVDASASYKSTAISANIEINTQTGLSNQSHSELKVLSFDFRSEFCHIDINEDVIFAPYMNYIRSDFKSDIINLPTVTDPQKLTSWTKYNDFFKKWGTHIIKSITLGGSVTINYSSNSSSIKNTSSLKVKACLGATKKKITINKPLTQLPVTPPPTMPPTCIISEKIRIEGLREKIINEAKSKAMSKAKSKESFQNRLNTTVTTASPNSCQGQGSKCFNVCAAYTSTKDSTTTTNEITSKSIIYLNDTDLSGQIISSNPYDLNNDILFLQQLTISSEDKPARIGYKYIPIWEFILKMYGIDSTQNTNGYDEIVDTKTDIISICNNLKTCYTLKDSDFTGTSYYEIPRDGASYEVHNKSIRDSYYPTDRKNPTVLGIGLLLGYDQYDPFKIDTPYQMTKLVRPPPGGWSGKWTNDGITTWTVGYRTSNGKCESGWDYDWHSIGWCGCDNNTKELKMSLLDGQLLRFDQADEYDTDTTLNIIRPSGFFPGHMQLNDSIDGITPSSITNVLINKKTDINKDPVDATKTYINKTPIDPKGKWRFDQLGRIKTYNSTNGDIDPTKEICINIGNNTPALVYSDGSDNSAQFYLKKFPKLPFSCTNSLITPALFGEQTTTSNAPTLV